MSARKELSAAERARIVSLRSDSGWTLSTIANTVGCSVSTVHNTVERFKELNNFDNRSGRG
ncbi:hypothetical protein OUZ56_033593 [Daphnia magna]|uniref:Uncharacterized protein n=1 Tax=Daphnia magna TaxID=35525 RepID=A0ABQ9ZY12_9CRUS|nr:hypothetical protein OUZ56_033593 [Daphnia magna]